MASMRRKIQRKPFQESVKRDNRGWLERLLDNTWLRRFKK